MSMAIIGAVVAGGTAIYGVAEGSNQKRRARHQLEALDRNKPNETIPDEVLQNQQLAKIRSNTGLPSEQFNMAQKDIQRQQLRSLRGAADRKMGLNLLPTIDDNAQRATENLNVANANARQNNEKILLDVNNQVGNFKKGLYDRNVRQPWDRQYEYNMALKGQGNQNISNAITSGVNLAGALIGSRGGSNSNWATSLFGNGRKKRDTGDYSYDDSLPVNG